MPRFASTRAAITKSGLLVASALVLAMAGGAVVVKTQALMGQGFERALSSQRGELSFETVAHRPDQTVGDEGYWLTRAEMQTPAVLAKPFAVGDRVTITGTDGRERKLEVTDVKAISPDGRNKGAALLLVTCRVTEDGAEAAPVRFIMEGQAPKTPAAVAAPKAL